MAQIRDGYSNTNQGSWDRRIDLGRTRTQLFTTVETKIWALCSPLQSSAGFIIDNYVDVRWLIPECGYSLNKHSCHSHEASRSRTPWVLLWISGLRTPYWSHPRIWYQRAQSSVSCPTVTKRHHPQVLTATDSKAYLGEAYFCLGVLHSSPCAFTGFGNTLC